MGKIRGDSFKKGVIGVYAVLMSLWISSKPLNVIIMNTIKHFNDNNKKISRKSKRSIIIDIIFIEDKFHFNHINTNYISEFLCLNDKTWMVICIFIK